MAPAITIDDSRDNELFEHDAAVAKASGKATGLTPLQAISQGVCLPGIPTFNAYEKERQWMLEHMAGAFRVFARYVRGSAVCTVMLSVRLWARY
jgi:hypothetical protein